MVEGSAAWGMTPEQFEAVNTALFAYWTSREDARLAQIAKGTTDVGGRLGVTAGGHLDRVAQLLGRYVTGRLKDGDTQPLMRLRYGGSAARWGFAIYLGSKDGYQDSVLPAGAFAGAPENALDTACGLYLGDPTTWI
jgi:hypothetical protein